MSLIFLFFLNDISPILYNITNKIRFKRILLEKFGSKLTLSLYMYRKLLESCGFNKSKPLIFFYKVSGLREFNSNSHN